MAQWDRGTSRGTASGWRPLSQPRAARNAHRSPPASVSPACDISLAGSRAGDGTANTAGARLCRRSLARPREPLPTRAPWAPRAAAPSAETPRPPPRAQHRGQRPPRHRGQRHDPAWVRGEGCRLGAHSRSPLCPNPRARTPLPRCPPSARTQQPREGPDMQRGLPRSSLPRAHGPTRESPRPQWELLGGLASSARRSAGSWGRAAGRPRGKTSFPHIPQERRDPPWSSPTRGAGRPGPAEEGLSGGTGGEGRSAAAPG